MERVTVHQLERWRTAYTLGSGDPRHGLNQWQRPRLGAWDRSPAGTMANYGKTWINGEPPTALERVTVHQLEPWRTTAKPESMANRPRLWSVWRFTSWKHGKPPTPWNQATNATPWINGERPRLGRVWPLTAWTVANRLHRGIRRTTPRPESRATPTAWGVDGSPAGAVANRLHRGECFTNIVNF